MSAVPIQFDRSASDPVLREAIRAEVQAAVRAEMAPLLADFRSFVDRRFDEVSSEVHAVLEFFDLSGSNIQQQLGAMRQEISAVVTKDLSGQSDNSGVELEAVVKITEEAANKIMEAAEAIAGRLEQAGAAGGEAGSAIMAQLNSIFEACAFQDLTGQRVRRAIDRLATIENRLQLFAQHLDKEETEVDRMAQAATTVRQDDIDRLLNG
jgi:chemotaxis protein CheZ